jgi:pyridoxine kinase
MADNGRLYPAFDMDYARKNTELCAHADIIVPNITEACLLTGLPVPAGGAADAVIPALHALLEALQALGARTAVLTGVSLSPGQTGVCGCGEHFFSCQTERLDASYHGTGDLFSSVSAGAITLGIAPEDAFRLACEFTAETIRATLAAGSDPRGGILFERCLPDLIRRVQVLLKG